MQLTTARRLTEFTAALLASPPAQTAAPPPAPAGLVAAWRAGKSLAAGQWQPAPGKKGFYRLTAGAVVRELETSLRPAETGQGLELAVRIWSQRAHGGPITTDVLELQAVTDANAQAAIKQLAPRVRQAFGLAADAPLFADTRKAPKLAGAGKAEAET